MCNHLKIKQKVLGIFLDIFSSFPHPGWHSTYLFIYLYIYPSAFSVQPLNHWIFQQALSGHYILSYLLLSLSTYIYVECRYISLSLYLSLPLPHLIVARVAQPAGELGDEHPPRHRHGRLLHLHPGCCVQKVKISLQEEFSPPPIQPSSKSLDLINSLALAL